MGSLNSCNRWTWWEGLEGSMCCRDLNPFLLKSNFRIVSVINWNWIEPKINLIFKYSKIYWKINIVKIVESVTKNIYFFILN